MIAIKRITHPNEGGGFLRLAGLNEPKMDRLGRRVMMLRDMRYEGIRYEGIRYESMRYEGMRYEGVRYEGVNYDGTRNCTRCPPKQYDADRWTH